MQTGRYGFSNWPPETLFVTRCAGTQTNRATLPLTVLANGAVKAEYNVMIPMRARLSTDIYRPAADGKFPVILVRDPYSNGDNSVVTGRWVGITRIRLPTSGCPGTV